MLRPSPSAYFDNCGRLKLRNLNTRNEARMQNVDQSHRRRRSTVVASTYVYRVGRVGGVRYGGRVGYGGRYGYGRRGLGYGRGLAAGALVGGAVAGSGYYYGNTYGAAPVYADPDQTGSVDDIAYCVQRFRAYDRASGTYLGYDGRRHPCLTVE
jgi:BA14K-like protein